MEENIKILNMWNEKVKTLGKLKLKEAQELFIEMKKESNIKEKELKRKKLIEDTLYVPLNFINKNKDFFKYFPGYYCLYSIYTLLEAITNKLTEVDSSKLSKVKIDKLKYLLIDRGLTDSIQTFEESLLIDIEKAIIEDNYNSQILNTLLNGLNGEEVELIRKRFGIGEYRCHTLEEVAKQINVTRERVRQREIKTLSKLRRTAARKKVRY